MKIEHQLKAIARMNIDQIERGCIVSLQLPENVFMRFAAVKNLNFTIFHQQNARFNMHSCQKNANAFRLELRFTSFQFIKD